MQDGVANGGDASGTNLRLAVRARIPLRVIERSRLTASALEACAPFTRSTWSGPPTPSARLLVGFVQTGGLLVVGPSWQKVEFPEHQNFVVVPAGKGRVVVFREDSDPSELAKSLVDLIGRDNLGVRLFRAASVLNHMTAARRAQTCWCTWSTTPRIPRSRCWCE